MNFLVPHDGSEHAYKALAQTVELSKKLGGDAKIEVVIVVPGLCLTDVGLDECKSISTLYEEAQGIKAKINEKLTNCGTSAEVRIEAGSAAESTFKCADEFQADFIVVGAAAQAPGTPYLVPASSRETLLTYFFFGPGFFLERRHGNQ